VAGAAAPSRTAEHESVQSVAKAIGSSVEAQRARAAWRRGLVAHIERQKRDPAGDGRSTDIVVSFRIDHHGRLIASEIVKGSGDARYDQAALDMVRRADPMPPPPAEVPDENLRFRIPISFRSGG
jgi:periplasmic protein TonB